MCQQEACSVTSVWGQALINIPEWGLCLQRNQKASPRDGGLCGHPPFEIFLLLPPCSQVELGLWHKGTDIPGACCPQSQVGPEGTRPKDSCPLEGSCKNQTKFSFRGCPLCPCPFSIHTWALCSIPLKAPGSEGRCASRRLARLQVCGGRP